MTKASAGTSSRSRNFTQRENNLLIELILKNKDIVENKETDGKSNDIKNRAWGKIAITFNQQTVGDERSEKQLRSKWDNLKKDARTYHAEHMRRKYITGEGPRQTTINDSFEKIITIIRSSAKGFESSYDNDSICKKTKKDHVLEKSSREIDDDVVFEFLSNSSDDVSTWKQWSKEESKKKNQSSIKIINEQSTGFTLHRKKKINPDKSVEIIKKYVPVPQLNIDKNRITDRLLEQLTDDNLQMSHCTTADESGNERELVSNHIHRSSEISKNSQSEPINFSIKKPAVSLVAVNNSEAIPSNDRITRNINVLQMIKKSTPTTSHEGHQEDSTTSDEIDNLIELMASEIKQKVPLEMVILQAKLEKDKLECHLLKMEIEKKNN